jgi:hypothetical protein
MAGLRFKAFHCACGLEVRLAVSSDCAAGGVDRTVAKKLCTNVARIGSAMACEYLRAAMKTQSWKTQHRNDRMDDAASARELELA